MSTITVECRGAAYVALDQGLAILTASHLSEMRAPLSKRLSVHGGKIIYQRPSWPGRTSPVTLFDSRPDRNYVGGPWAR